jgi:hypothetical protein
MSENDKYNQFKILETKKIYLNSMLLWKKRLWKYLKEVEIFYVPRHVKNATVFYFLSLKTNLVDKNRTNGFKIIVSQIFMMNYQCLGWFTIV